jgi:uncharacterized lipoprotein NlpE involved in copper resistance
MKFFTIALFMLCMCACDETKERESCWISSEKYISTHFDCGDYSVEYSFCSYARWRSTCTSPDPAKVPEILMGHCISRNICL